MNQILAIVLPVFGLIGVGYAVAWSRLLGKESGEGVAEFTYAVAIPLLIFRTILDADFAGVSPWRLWLPFFAVFAVMWVAGTFLIRRLFGRDARSGVVAGVSSAYGNTVLVGIPLALAAYGPQGTVPMALIVAVHLPVMMSVSAALIGRAERQDGVGDGHVDARAAALAVARNLARNPIILALAAGGLWRLLAVPYGGLPAVLVDRLADVASTLALFALGMSLRRYGIRGNIRAGLALAALKLLVQPALVLLLTRYAFALPPIWVKAAVLAAACPTGVNAFLVASRFKTGEGLASNAITLSTGLAVFSVAFWLHVLDWL